MRNRLLEIVADKIAIAFKSRLVAPNVLAEDILSTISSHNLSKCDNFAEWYNEHEHDCGMCSPPLDPQLGLDFLTHYLLGDDVTVSISQSKEQMNTVAVYYILSKYSKQFNKDLKAVKSRKG